MSLFGSIVDKIVHYAENAVSPQAAAPKPAETPEAPASGAASGAAAESNAAPAAASPGPTAAAPLQSIDVGATLTALDAQKGGGLNWQSSIVDLLKLLDLDSSLAARKTLAQELDVHAGEDGTSEQNIALHKAVVQKLAENGGKLPASMQG